MKLAGICFILPLQVMLYHSSNYTLKNYYKADYLLCAEVYSLVYSKSGPYTGGGGGGVRGGSDDPPPPFLATLACTYIFFRLNR